MFNGDFGSRLRGSLLPIEGNKDGRKRAGQENNDEHPGGKNFRAFGHESETISTFGSEALGPTMEGCFPPNLENQSGADMVRRHNNGKDPNASQPPKEAVALKRKDWSPHALWWWCKVERAFGPHGDDCPVNELSVPDAMPQAPLAYSLEELKAGFTDAFNRLYHPMHAMYQDKPPSGPIKCADLLVLQALSSLGIGLENRKYIMTLDGYSTSTSEVRRHQDKVQLLGKQAFMFLTDIGGHHSMEFDQIEKELRRWKTRGCTPEEEQVQGHGRSTLDQTS